jgi:signal transduction histidine kinase
LWVAVVLVLVAAAVGGEWGALATPWLIPTLAVGVAGAVLRTRVPGNPIGRLLMVFGVGALLSFVGLVVAPEGGTQWLQAISRAVNTMAVVTMPLVLIRFPDGALPSRRWRWAEMLVFAAAALGGTAALINNGWGGDATQALVHGPLRAAYGPLGDILSRIFFVLLLVTLVLSLGAASARFMRSESEERLQIRWLLFAAALVVAASLSVGVNIAQGTWEEWLMSVAFAAVPGAIGVAVLRYRLYDIDLVISRTLMIGMLGGFITAVYALVVVGIGSLLGGAGDLALSIGSTALVAVLFEPVRSRAQRAANRVVFGNRATPYEVLADLTGRLSRAESHEGLLGRMAQRLADGTGADRAVVWSDDVGGFTPVAAYPEGAVTPVGTLAEVPGWAVPMVHDDITIGALSVEARRGGELTPTERHLVEDLAGSAGLVLRRVRLDAALAEHAGELAESRRRLLGAEDAERRSIERTLEGGVQQEVVAIKLRLGIAAQTARSEEATQAADLLGQMADDAHSAIDQIRTLARGIFPPLLESEGLRAAISTLAQQAPIATSVDVGDLGDVPRSVKAALYFALSEAMTNAVKHAVGPVGVSVSRSDDHVRFRVTDAGPGFDLATAARGSGLANLTDRVEALGGELVIDSSPGSPTVVSGWVPAS